MFQITVRNQSHPLVRCLRYIVKVFALRLKVVQGAVNPFLAGLFMKQKMFELCLVYDPYSAPQKELPQFTCG